MKLSDYVIEFLEQKKIRHMFFLPGGGCMHLLDSLGRTREIEGISMLHEQAAAIAAESYAFTSGGPGALLVTTGPGGTNAITGVLSAFIDSMPCFVLSGQVKTADLKSRYGVRQLGSQEADIISMVKNITKYAVMVTDKDSIRFHMEKAWHEMVSGRKGPVWLDIPLDIQGAEIEPEQLEGFIAQEAEPKSPDVREIVSMLKCAERPLILIGNGLRDCTQQLHRLLNRLKIPVIPSWKAADLLPNDHPLFAGKCGTLGERAANFAMQTADAIFSLGCKLDYSITGFDRKKWAVHAKKAVVDIDAAEIRKLEAADINIAVAADAKDVIERLLCEKIAVRDLSAWWERIRYWQRKYPVLPGPDSRNGRITTYGLMQTLFSEAPGNTLFVPASAGTVAEIFYQSLQLRRGQMVRSNHGLGAMGFEIPAAVGAWAAEPGRPVICVAGDGGIQLNIEELAVIAGRNLPVKIFVVNNAGYASIRSMQRNHFEGRFFGSNSETGLFIPNLTQIAQAYGLRAVSAEEKECLRDAVRETLAAPGPALCNVMVDPDCIVSPRAASRVTPEGGMVSTALEDLYPFLPEKELQEALYIK